MNKSRPDRRINRSRRHLKESLAVLLQERDYDDITVQEIAERADVGRSTFYAHFESKEDLLFAGFDHHLMQLVDQSPSGVPPERDAVRFRFSLPLLRHVRQHRRFFEATILGASDARLRRISAGILADMVSVELDRIAPALDEDWLPVSPLTPGDVRAARARAVVGAFVGLLDWWLSSADHLMEEEVDTLFHRIVLPNP